MLDRIFRDGRSTPLGMIARLLFIDVTAVDDGLSHRVSQQTYDEALAAGIGRYETDEVTVRPGCGWHRMKTPPFCCLLTGEHQFSRVISGRTARRAVERDGDQIDIRAGGLPRRSP